MDDQGRGVTPKGAFCSALILGLWVYFVTLPPLPAAAPDGGWSPLGEALTAENAGLFVGVNDYPKETILPLKFSVNDAVAQADMFVMRLKLIPAQRCRLLLAGNPTARYTPKLKALQDAGAVVVPTAGRAAILFHLETVRRLTSGSNSLLVVSFSGHGNEYRGTPYFIPSDGLAGIPSSFLALTTDVANGLATTGRQKRLMFIDACRLDFAPGQKGNYRLPEVTAAFRQAFSETKGLVTLASCGAGEASLEDPRSESGVFTGKLLTALDEGIGGVDSEFITLGQVSAYLQSAVPKRAAELAANDHRINEAQIQHVWHQGTLDALDVPLALSPHADVARRKLIDRKLRAKMLVQEAARSSSSDFKPALLNAVEAAIEELRTARPGGLLDRIEIALPRGSKRDPKSFVVWWEEERRHQVAEVATAKGELEPPQANVKETPQSETGKAVFLVAPLAGIERGAAEATQASFEEALKLPAEIEVKPLEDEATVQGLDLATAERILREKRASMLIVGRFGEVKMSHEKGQIGQKLYDHNIWEIPLTVTVFSLDQGKIMTRRKPFVGEAKLPVRDRAGDGRQDAIADAIDRLKSDAGRWIGKNN